MRLIDRFVATVTHRDYDLYVLLVGSVVLTVVELFESNWVLALFAGILGGFAVSIVRMRHDIGQRSGLASMFLNQTPADVVSSMMSARELLLVGVSLDRTLRSAYAQLESFLKRRGQLRVLVVDPRSEWSVKVADRRAYHVQGVDRRRAHIEASIASFRELGQRTGGDVQIKVTDDPLTFGAIMINGTEAANESQIVIQHYSYKKRNAAEPNPVFVVRPSDREWFAEFREELENLWHDGVPLQG